MPFRGGSILPAFVDVAHFSLSQTALVKRQEPGRGDPGRNGRVNGGKLRWDWGRIVNSRVLLNEPREILVQTPSDWEQLFGFLSGDRMIVPIDRYIGSCSCPPEPAHFARQHI
jgi:hypothetical protein